VASFGRRVKVELAANERDADPVPTAYSFELAQSAPSIASGIIS
jgi:hypothetical protein